MVTFFAFDTLKQGDAFVNICNTDHSISVICSKADLKKSKCLMKKLAKKKYIRIICNLVFEGR